jgi:hypothetical protein
MEALLRARKRPVAVGQSRMTTAERNNAILKHVWSEPRFVAEVEWMADHPGPTLAQRAHRAGATRHYKLGSRRGMVLPVAKVTLTLKLLLKRDSKGGSLGRS